MKDVILGFLAQRPGEGVTAKEIAVALSQPIAVVSRTLSAHSKWFARRHVVKARCQNAENKPMVYRLSRSYTIEKILVKSGIVYFYFTEFTDPVTIFDFERSSVMRSRLSDIASKIKCLQA